MRVAAFVPVNGRQSLAFSRQKFRNRTPPNPPAFGDRARLNALARKERFTEGKGASDAVPVSRRAKKEPRRFLVLEPAGPPRPLISNCQQETRP